MPTHHYDVAIIGGGPSGTTAGSLLKKYDPALRAVILEKERFPRPHIGESQLPALAPVLDEMGVWDKVEAAGFPIKLGGSFTWGSDQESWDFNFYPEELFQDEPRPARYQGQRLFTAFQVERAIYDTILLRHAESLGVEVREATMVRDVKREGDRITGFELDSGETITARHYLDGSGSPAVLRRAMGVVSVAPRELRNIAIWDYWENAEWAVHIGIGGTKIQVRSLPYGWIWFIPLGPTRTSVGLVCPSEYYKQRGLSSSELYHAALKEQPQIAHLLRNATARGDVETTKDWSHLSERLVGENWFLIGEACGFADPILSAGMTLAHQSARHAAYTILELDRGELDAAWLRSWYNERNRLNIGQHIRFAQFWYASNGCFKDLKENCRKIADEAGMSLSPKEAWEWLARGGFSADNIGLARAGSFNVAGSKRMVEHFFGQALTYSLEDYNRFELNLQGAKAGFAGSLIKGRIKKVPCYRRDGRMLPRAADYGIVLSALERTSDGQGIMDFIRGTVGVRLAPTDRQTLLLRALQALEAMIHDGWVTTGFDPRRPKIELPPAVTPLFRTTAEGEQAMREKKSSQAG
ncbi:MAG: tryptophan 7-halogenase [Phycisphaeraceae bacterium]|nr:tryptophan 7-halogenase [Phycisphaeraceae bacterium]